MLSSQNVGGVHPSTLCSTLMLAT